MQGLIIVLAFLAFGASLIFKVTFIQGFVIVMVVLTVGFIVHNNAKVALEKKEFRNRYDSLINQYHDEKIVEAILSKKLSQGMSDSVVLSMFGQPVDMDKKVLRGKESLTFKYGQTGVNRFTLRVYLENNIVVGWEMPQVAR